MTATAPPSREEFLATMAIEATKLERLARELREGKWDTFNIEKKCDRIGDRYAKPTQEKVTIGVTASRKQAYGTGLDPIDEEPAPAHQFEESWQPHPEKRGDENERYEATCSVCGLTIVDPTDVYPIDHCPAVKALSKEWLTMMGHPAECVPKQEQKRPYAPPTLRVLDPNEVIRKLLKASEQANGVPSGGEHQHEKGARKAQASELRDLAVAREPIDQRTGDGEEHGNESSHVTTIAPPK